jgi:glucose/arabinose dehydrogenase
MRVRTIGAAATALAAALAGFAGSGVAGAQGAAAGRVVPFAGMSAQSYDWAALARVQAATPGYTVVADHLDNPRGISIAPNGDVYDAEAGAGGRLCFPGNQCGGFTGSVLRVHDGVALPVLSGLVSIAGKDGTFAVGSDDVVPVPGGGLGMIVTSAGLPNPPGLPVAATRQLGHVLTYDSAGLHYGGDVAKYEFRHDPDGQGKDSDPYGIAYLGHGAFAVADAAADDILEVAADGTVSVIAILPNNSVGAQAVPTSLTIGPDGAIYVGELGGEEHGGTPAGGARVWRIDRHTHALSEYATGFTHITGIAFGPDGSLYVTELTRDPTFQNPAGDVVRVAPDGTRTRLGTHLVFPAGVGVDSSGHVFVNNASVLPANTAAAPPFFGMHGQLVELDS